MCSKNICEMDFCRLNSYFALSAIMISENFLCRSSFVKLFFFFLFSKNGSAADRPSNMQPAALRLRAGSLVPPGS